ncbi:shikimate kinase AroK [Halotalea alkalilenta]|uniref:Shikimate kinase n=1 Tax=Halotalea alkalilenta TaxID=376489 RepID=A0A172YD13_9GAMM|nr:shikimate kinase AroK [Halotalea alkalilenta]ANF56992.1 shikimate kinase [Halotalea alkalilenta]
MRDSLNIFLIGPMGTGKSTIGRLLAAELQRPFFDSDHEIERRCGCDIPWIFDVEGEAGFRAREAQVIDDLSTQQGVVLATGGGAVTHPESRRLLRERGTVIFLRTSVEQQLKRTARDRNRPLLQCEDPGRKLRELFEVREPLYRATADLVISTERRSPRSVVNDIRRQLHLHDDLVDARG